MGKVKYFVYSLFLVPTITFGKELKTNTGDRSLPDLLNNVANYMLAFFAGLAILFIIIAGIRLIVSSGNPDEAKTAKQNLTYAIIGLIAVIFAKFVLMLIMNIIGEVA